MRYLLLVLAVCGCATLNTANMTPQCRDLYNACLNGCPQQSNRVAAGNGDIDSISKAPGSIGSAQLDMNTASCTDKCNQDQKQCK